MTKYFNTGKRLFKLRLTRWREKKLSGKYIRYYIKPAVDGRNVLARNIDFYGPLVVLLLATYALVAIYSGSYLLALVLGLPVMAGEIFIALRLRRMFQNNTITHNKLWMAGRKCQEDIGKITDIDEFSKLVIEILGKVPGLTDVHIVKDRGITGYHIGIDIAARAIRQGIPIAIGCLIPGFDKSELKAKMIFHFKEELKSLNIREGILVAAGNFSVEAKRAALEGKNKIILVDQYKLVELARLTGHPVFPAAGDPANDSDKKDLLYSSLIRYAFAREKAKGYFFAGGIMLLLYYIASVADFFNTGYLLFGIFNLGLSIYCLLSNREKDFFYLAEKEE